MKYALYLGPRVLLEVEGSDSVCLAAVANRLRRLETEDRQRRQLHHVPAGESGPLRLIVGDNIGNRVYLEFTSGGQVGQP